MKKTISALIVIFMLISMLSGLSVFAAETTPLYETSFEGDWLTGEWYEYNKAYHEEGVLYDGTNTDSAYVTEGEQSLYLLDNSTSYYAAISSPLTQVTEFGRYTLSADVRVLSGSLRLFIRCFESDKKTYVQKELSIPQNSGFENYSFSYIVTPDTPYVRILFISAGADGVGEGYYDNVKLTKTGDYDVNSIALCKSLSEEISTAQPGDVIEIDDGTYTDVIVNFDANGTDTNPITLKAKNPGKVIFKGDSAITVSGTYLVIDGLRFEEVTTSQIVKFTTGSSYCQIKNSAFYNCHPDINTSQYWVMLRGLNLKVSNCFFSGKQSMGQMVESTKSEATKDTPDNHIIENCYFGDITMQSANGYEAIRMGSSTYCFSNSNSTVSGCFFYKCDGESETVSVKSCDNLIKNNTFYNNRGAVVLRHGDRNEIMGNLFVGGDETTRATGIRIIGEDHKVHDNYFYNMPKKSQVIFYYNGCPYDGIENHWYYPVKNAQVYNNTFIGGDKLVVVGDYTPNKTDPSFNRVMAPQGSFYNNAIVSYTGTNPIFANGDPGESLGITDNTAYNQVTFSNNYAYGKDLGYTDGLDGVSKGYFKLAANGDYFKPANGSGADLDIVKNAPTSPFEIIPDWVKTVYYDGGLVTFDVVDEDPFNDVDAHINNIIPFDVTASVEAGDGIVTLYENGASVSGNSKSVSGNPTIKVTAAPDDNWEVSAWYINGVLLNESNISSLGVNASDAAANEITIDNLTEKYDIKVEFEKILILPDVLEGAVSSFGGAADDDSPLIVQSQTGAREITGNYMAVATKVLQYENYTVKEYGMLFSTAENEFNTTVQSKIELTSDGAFGVLFYNLTNGTTYYVKPYVVYADENNTQTTVYGTVTAFTVK